MANLPFSAAVPFRYQILNPFSVLVNRRQIAAFVRKMEDGGGDLKFRKTLVANSFAIHPSETGKPGKGMDFGVFNGTWLCVTRGKFFKLKGESIQKLGWGNINGRH